MSFPLNRLRRSSRVKVIKSQLVVSVSPPSPGSSTDVSEDWEKDFDLDMTEEEVQMALSKIEASGEVCWFLFFYGGIDMNNSCCIYSAHFFSLLLSPAG